MWTSAGPADRHSWRPKPGPTSPPSADRRRPGTRGARPPARRSRWAPTPADRPGPGRLPARSWCVAHPGGPVKPPAVPRAARRIRPSRCRPRKPADRGARPGRHRVPRIPIGRCGVELPDYRRRRPQRPAQPGVVGMGRRRTKQRPAKDQYAAAQNPPHLCSAAPRGRFGQSPPPVLWTMSSLWIPLPGKSPAGSV